MDSENCFEHQLLTMTTIIETVVIKDKKVYSFQGSGFYYNEMKPADPTKTGPQAHVGARNRAAHRALSIAGDHAWEDMRAVQERFGKTDGVVALHAYQSFRESEVTPEQFHEIGVALARRVWGKRFQVLVATHMNTDNLHNHFVILSLATMLLQLHGLLSAVPHLICPPAKNLFYTF